MISRLRTSTTIACLVGLLVITGCGSSDGPSDAASSKGTSSTAPGPSGEPIKLMQWTPDNTFGVATELYDGANSAAHAINDEGGVKDPAGGPNRPIEIVKCTVNTVDDGTQSRQCARQAIDQKMLALTGKYAGKDEGVKALTDAGIPVVQAFPTTPQDSTLSLSFPVAGGLPPLAAGLGAALQSQGASKVELALADTGPARAFPALAGKLLENGAADVKGTIFYPIDPSADVTPFAAQIVNEKPDGVAVVSTPDRTVAMIQALRTAGFEGKIAVAGFNLGRSQIKTLGSAAEGVIVVSNYAAATSKSDPEIDRFNAAMDEYAPKAERSEFAIGSWVSVNVIAGALSHARSIDAAGLAAALQGLKVTRGAAPTYTLGVSGLKLVPFPRVPRDTIQFQVIKKGKAVPVKDGVFFHVDSAKS